MPKNKNPQTGIPQCWVLQEKNTYIMRSTEQKPPTHQDQFSFQQQSESGSQSEQSDYKQKQAFHIPEVNSEQGMDPEELDAFRYLMSVRQQAQGIKEARKKQRKEMKKMGKVDNKQEPHIQPQIVKQTSNLPEWFQVWKQQTVKNWQCLVQNFKYLHKQANPSHCLTSLSASHPALNPKSQPSAIMAQKPHIESLQSLTLGIIEQLISVLSQEHYRTPGRYYYLWVYSLLAAHRALASYSIFEALADVNACLGASMEPEGKDRGAESLVVCCILEGQFHQTGLRKFYHKMIQMVPKNQ